MITKNVNGNNISQDFIDQIRSDSPNVIAKLMLNGSELSCDIMSLQVTKGSCGSTELTLGNVVGDMLTASVKNLSTAIKGEDIECYIGAWTGADYEYISLGVFVVTEAKKTRYTTEITAYSSVVGKTATLYVGNNSAPSIAELGSNIATIMGCTMTFDPAIDTAQIVHANVLESTLYQCLQAIAISSGAYIVNDNAGNILVKRYDSTPTLSVDTGMMVRLPEVDEAPVEVRSVKCNGEYPYSAQIAFLADEQDRNIVDQSDNLIFGYDTADNADVQFNCDYMTDEVFNANVISIIGYSYWHATVGLTLGDPRLEGVDVLAVEDVDGTIYNVPCHEITHRYSGGFASDIRSAKPTEQQVDIGSVSNLGASMELAYQAFTKAKTTSQYLWFVPDGDEAGVHITSEPKDDFESNPDGGNLLARSDGLIMRDGLDELATFKTSGVVLSDGTTELSKFSQSETRIGEVDSSHVSITPTGMKLYSEDGTTVGATIESGSIVLGGVSNNGGNLVVYDEDGAQVGQINNDGIVALAGQIADFTIDSDGLTYASGSNNASITNSGIWFEDSTRRTKLRSFSVEIGQMSGGSYSYIGDLNAYSDDGIWLLGKKVVLANRNSTSSSAIGRLTVDSSGNVGVYGTFTVTGTKSRKAETENYSERLLYCYETPTPLFGDIGEAVLDESGICYVDLDDIFSETIADNVEYQVFLQKEGEGDCYVSEKERRYFAIQGTPNLKVAWELKAKQKGYENIRLEEPNEYTDYEQVNDDIYDYIEEQERLLYG